MEQRQSRIERIAAARSFLFVPGDRPDRFDKAVTSGADVVILDLEDAVPPDSKVTARDAVRSWLKADREVLIRINASDTFWFEDDLQLAGENGLLGFMLPKAEAGRSLERVASLLPTVALIESARGLVTAREVAATAGVQRLAFGTVDLALDLDISSDEVLQVFGAELVLASRANELAAPIDGVSLDFRNASRVTEDVRLGRTRGFGGKLCIHPAQLPAVRSAFRPTSEQLAWAQRVIAVDRDAEGSAVSLDGQMIDRPVVAKAIRLLEDAAESE